MTCLRCGHSRHHHHERCYAELPKWADRLQCDCLGFTEIDKPLPTKPSDQLKANKSFQKARETIRELREAARKSHPSNPNRHE